jgi:hypothetical protein
LSPSVIRHLNSIGLSVLKVKKIFKNEKKLLFGRDKYSEFNHVG